MPLYATELLPRHDVLYSMHTPDTTHTHYYTHTLLWSTLIYLPYPTPLLLHPTPLYSTPFCSIYATLPNSNIRSSTLLEPTPRQSTLLYSTLLYSTLLYSSLLCSTLLYAYSRYNTYALLYTYSALVYSNIPPLPDPTPTPPYATLLYSILFYIRYSTQL